LNPTADMAPIPRLRSLAKVTQASPKGYTAEGGYLVVVPGNEVQVLYVGHGASKGWLFASMAGNDGTLQGWLPTSTIVAKQAAALDEDVKAIRAAARWQ